MVLYFATENSYNTHGTNVKETLKSVRTRQNDGKMIIL